MSRFVISVVISAMFLALACTAPDCFRLSRIDVCDMAVSRSWSWWTVQVLRELAREPDIVLLGSSLMVVANAECDATVYGTRLDLTTYRKARYLEFLLRRSRETIERPPSALNLASPGQIPSDAFLTYKTAQKLGAHPRLVIYGLAPRDFIDGTLQSPMETEAYQCLSRITDARRVDSLLLDSRLDAGGGSCVLTGKPVVSGRLSRWLEGLRGRVNGTTFRATDRFLDHVHKKTGLAGGITLRQRMELIDGYKPLEMEPGFIHAEVAKRGTVAARYTDNLDDYRARYRSPDMESYRRQLAVLRELASDLLEDGVSLVLVNMPITRANVELLEHGLHQRYLKDIHSFEKMKNVFVTDLCDFDHYDREDFRDSVHLSGFGGKKFLEALAARMMSRKLI